MKTDEFICISYNNVEYRVNREKIEYVLSCLENKNIKIKSQKTLSELLMKYSLYDETFLENINKI